MADQHNSEDEIDDSEEVSLKQEAPMQSIKSEIKGPEKVTPTPTQEQSISSDYDLKKAAHPITVIFHILFKCIGIFL
jgi:hypothetical protein